MKSNLSRHLRQAIRQAQCVGHPKHHRYAPALRRDVVAYTRTALSALQSITGLA